MHSNTAGVVWPGQEGIVRSIHQFEADTPWLHGAMTAFAKYGVVIFGLLLVWSWWRSRGRDVARVAAALWAPVGVLLAVGLNQPFGHLFQEPRPYAVLANFEPLVSRTSDFSFPSDHAVMAGAAAAGVLLASRRLGIMTTALAVLMAFARVYVGAHFLGDVLAGLAFGMLVTTLGWLACRRLVIGAVTRIAHGPLAFVAH